MRVITQEITLYTFDDAPSDIKKKIKDRFRCDYDIYEFCMKERIATLKAFADRVDADLDYSLSCVPDRGEYIRITPKYNDEDMQAAIDEMLASDDCSLTGVCYDYDLIGDIRTKGLHNALVSYINSIHSEYESMLTDEYLSDHCAANEYEFTSDGRIYQGVGYDQH